jgi:mannosyltransferase OCH1-like enzyme
MDKIPLKIHYIFLNKEEAFPELFTTCFERAKSLHPQWDIRLYNENDAQNIISEHIPELLGVYNSYTHTVQKSDILRILLVYLFGGFYLDLDIFCLKKLDELTNFQVVLGEEKTISPEELKSLGLKHSFRIANYMFGSIPRHPFWLYFLKEAIKKSTNKIYTENDILETTGPGLLTNIFYSKRLQYKEITVLRNNDRLCLRPGHKAISCHFGNFAAHLHQGSWRWGGLNKVNQNESFTKKNKWTKTIGHINSLLKDNRGDFNKIIILKANSQELNQAQNLKQVYENLKTVCKTVSDSNNVSDSTVLVFGNPSTNKSKTSKSNTNYIYAIWDDRFLTNNWVKSINNNYNYCIVPHACIKEAFQSSGVTIPIEVINLGFTKLKRNFCVEDDSVKTDFTIGFSGTTCKNDLKKIIIACKNIKNNFIPELKLKMLWNSDISHRSPTLQGTGSHDCETWIENTYTLNELSNWYDDMHCYISINSKDRWSLGPMESLYLGIPSIITEEPIYDELINSGFYEVIKPDKLKNNSLSDSKIQVGIGDIERSILEVYNKYEHYNNIAIEGALWIEDKWSCELAQNEILKFIQRKETEKKKK